jgi:hypothetical protein
MRSNHHRLAATWCSKIELRSNDRLFVSYLPVHTPHDQIAGDDSKIDCHCAITGHCTIRSEFPGTGCINTWSRLKNPSTVKMVVPSCPPPPRPLKEPAPEPALPTTSLTAAQQIPAPNQPHTVQFAAFRQQQESSPENCSQAYIDLLPAGDFGSPARSNIGPDSQVDRRP